MTLDSTDTAGSPAELLLAPTLEEIRDHLRCLRTIAERGGRATRDESEDLTGAVFRRDGDFWTLSYAGKTVRQRDLLGYSYLACLLGRPGQPIAALDLLHLVRSGEACGERGNGGGSAVLDEKAIGQYRLRLQTLREDLEEAKSRDDVGRCERLEAEIAFLLRELARAVGLGGRARRFPSEAERARLSVTRTIRTAHGRIAEEHAPLGRHLARAIHTGALCCYDPDPATLPEWEVGR